MLKAVFLSCVCMIPSVFGAAPLLSVSVSDGALARPLLEVEADCHDELGDCNVWIQILPNDSSPINLVQGVNHIKTVLDLSAYEGTLDRLTFWASHGDDITNLAYIPRTVLSLSSPHYRPIHNVPGSSVIAVNENYVLFGIPNRTPIPNSYSALWLKDRFTHSQTQIGTNIPVGPRPVLTSGGAAFGRPSGSNAQLLYYTRGEYTEIGTPIAWDESSGFGFLRASTKYVLAGNEGNPRRFLLRDTIAKTNLIFSLPEDAGSVKYSYVADNGSVLFAADHLYQFRDGQLRTIYSSTTTSPAAPESDGTNSVWIEFQNSAYPINTIKAETPQGVIELSSGFTGDDVFGGNQEAYLTPALPPYLINSGLIAFERPNSTGGRDVWLRQSDGREDQMTFFSQLHTRLRALSPSGALLVSTDEDNMIYTVAPSRPVQPIGADFRRKFAYLSYNATFLFVGEELLCVLGSNVFDVDMRTPLLGLSSPTVDAVSGDLSVFATGTSPQQFAIEQTTNFVLWKGISTNSVTNTLPQRLVFPNNPHAQVSALRAKILPPTE